MNEKMRRTFRLFSYWFLSIGVLSFGVAVVMAFVVAFGPSGQRANDIGVTVGAFGTAFVNVLIGAGLRGVSRSS
jgi:hypothetical protein